MRADPDVIMLGEVRDIETAKLTLRAAETGHLVLATLHTGTVRGAMGRLRSLGVSDYDLKPLLRGVMVQRLVRTVCASCKGDGCETCLFTGYAGRTVVAECALFRNEGEVERATNGERWWPSMVSDAIGKIKQGLTTAEEVYRVFQSELDNQDEELEGIELLMKEMEMQKARQGQWRRRQDDRRPRLRAQLYSDIPDESPEIHTPARTVTGGMDSGARRRNPFVFMGYVSEDFFDTRTACKTKASGMYGSTITEQKRAIARLGSRPFPINDGDGNILEGNVVPEGRAPAGFDLASKTQSIPDGTTVGQIAGYIKTGDLRKSIFAKGMDVRLPADMTVMVGEKVRRQDRFSFGMLTSRPEGEILKILDQSGRGLDVPPGYHEQTTMVVDSGAIMRIGGQRTVIRELMRAEKDVFDEMRRNSDQLNAIAAREAAAIGFTGVLSPIIEQPKAIGLNLDYRPVLDQFKQRDGSPPRPGDRRGPEDVPANAGRARPARYRNRKAVARHARWACERRAEGPVGEQEGGPDRVARGRHGVADAADRLRLFVRRSGEDGKGRARARYGLLCRSGRGGPQPALRHSRHRHSHAPSRRQRFERLEAPIRTSRPPFSVATTTASCQI